MIRTPWIVLLLGLGCSTSNPEAGDLAAGPDAGQLEVAGQVRLEVTNSTPVTPWSVVPLTGVGPANGFLVYESQAGRKQTTRLGATGEFCIDIELTPGPNSITLEAIDEAGDYSDPVVVSVRREGVLPEAEPVELPDVVVVDRTPGTTFYGADSPYNPEWELTPMEGGAFADLVDGNLDQTLKFRSDIGMNEVVAFALKEPLLLHAVQVSVPDQGEDYCAPASYEIWVSDDIEPELTLDGVTWVKVATRSGTDISATATTYEDRSAVSSILASHIAIRLTEDTCRQFFFSGNIGTNSVYGLRELRILAESDDGSSPVVPDSGAPSCARGGF